MLQRHIIYFAESQKRTKL